MARTVKLSVSGFLRRFEDTKSTWLSYRVGCAAFFQWKFPELKQTNRQRIKWTNEYIEKLDELALKYLQSIPDYGEDLIAFKNNLRENNLAPKSIGAALTAIIQYFERNDVILSDVDKRDLVKGTQKAITEDIVPTAEQLIRIIEYLPIQGKTLTLLLTSSGMRIGEALQLTTKDIDLTKTPTEIRIIDNGKDRTTKTNESRTAYISAEATEQLKEWLDYLPTYLKQNSKLSKQSHDIRLFPFTQSNVLQLWTLAVEKAKYGEKDGRRLKLHIQCLRKYFRTRGNWKNPDIAEFLLGHRTALGVIYNRLEQNRDEVIKEYLEAMKHLQIYSHSRELVNLKEEVKEKNDQLRDMITSMTIKMTHLENQNFELDKRTQELENIRKLAGNIDSNQVKSLNTLVSEINESPKEIPIIRQKLIKQLDEMEKASGIKLSELMADILLERIFSIKK